jgi:hypothetical protein
MPVTPYHSYSIVPLSNDIGRMHVFGYLFHFQDFAPINFIYASGTLAGQTQLIWRHLLSYLSALCDVYHGFFWIKVDFGSGSCLF